MAEALTPASDRVAVFEGPDSLVEAARTALYEHERWDLVVVHEVGAMALNQAWSLHVYDTLQPTVAGWWEDIDGSGCYGAQLDPEYLTFMRSRPIGWHVDIPTRPLSKIEGPLTLSTRVDVWSPGLLKRTFFASQVPFASLDPCGRIVPATGNATHEVRYGQASLPITAVDQPQDTVVLMANHPFPRVHRAEEEMLTGGLPIAGSAIITSSQLVPRGS